VDWKEGWLPMIVVNSAYHSFQIALVLVQVRVLRVRAMVVQQSQKTGSH
jgi:hypothetical protein